MTRKQEIILIVSKPLRTSVTRSIMNIYMMVKGPWSIIERALAYSGMDKSEKMKDAMESLDILADIANVYIQKGLYDSAFWYFQLAFDQIKPGTNETDILHFPPEKLIEIKKIHYLTNLMIGKGDAYLQKYLKTKDNNDLSEVHSCL